MCQVQILSVNGIVPAGSSNPTHLKVTGRLSQCPGNQVVVTSNVTAASSPTSPAYGPNGDGFIVVLPITAPNVTCGDINNPVIVHAECHQRPACYDDDSGPLKCCEVKISGFSGIVLPGSLTPSRIRVSGTSQGCTSSPFLLNNPVIVQLTFTSGASVQSAPVPVDPLTGAYFVEISIPASTLVQCDDRVAIDAWCSTDINCKAQTLTERLDCPQCARATVTVASAGPCAGMPPKQPITLSATISIAQGAKRYFKWNYGDGSASPVFEINNTNGLATTQHTVPPYPPAVPPNPAVSPSHDYSPGTYFAELIVTDKDGAPLECDKIPLTVVASCGQCPSVSVSASQPEPCINGKRKVTLQTTVNSLPAPTVFQWSFGDLQVGLAKAATALGVWPSPADPAVNEHDYAPGTYIATLTNVLSPTCPSQSVTVMVPSCPAVCCPSVTIDRPQVVNNQPQPQVTGCAPTSAVATFTAQLSWMTGCTPVAPSSFEWTLNGPGGKKYQKSTNSPNTDTTAGWTDPAGNPAAVQFTLGGNYSISVTAVVPGVSLPCNPTDTAPFEVPNCCPQLIGPLNKSQMPGNPCIWTFSAQVSNPNNAPISLEWSFQDGATATTSVPHIQHTYTPGSSTSGFTTLTLKSPGCADQTLTTPVTHMCMPCPTGQHRDASGNCVPDTPPCPPGQHRDSSGNCVPDTVTTTTTTTTCDVLLWISLVLILLSGIGAVLGCIMSIFPALQAAAAIIGFISLGLLVIGGLLFFIWWLLCRRMTACPIILGAITFMRVLIAVFFVIGLVLGVIGLITMKFDWILCLAVSWIQSAIWGMLLSILYGVAVEVGCLVENPSGGPMPPSSSSSGLSSPEGGRERGRGSSSKFNWPGEIAAAPTLPLVVRGGVTPEPAHLLRLPWLASQRVIGLGDIVKWITSAFGIRPCLPCHQRAARLNKWGGLIGRGRAAPFKEPGQSSSGGV